jgi:hypothetical protein
MAGPPPRRPAFTRMPACTATTSRCDWMYSAMVTAVSASGDNEWAPPPQPPTQQRLNGDHPTSDSPASKVDGIGSAPPLSGFG